MNKRLLVLSMLVLSNGLYAMEVSDDWEDVGSNASQLMKDLTAIKEEKDREMRDWEDLDPMGTQMHGIITINDNYLDLATREPVPMPSASTTPAPASTSSPTASTTSLTSVSVSSASSRISDFTTDDASSMTTKPIPEPSSPVGALHYGASSLRALASSIISDGSIETSAREDRGAYCGDRLDDESSAIPQQQQQKKKRKLPKKKAKQEAVEDLVLKDFALEIFKYVLGLSPSTD